MDTKEKEATGFHSPSDGDPEDVEMSSHAAGAPAVSEAAFVKGKTLYARIQRVATRFGVEPRGIERVPEDERTDAKVMKIATMVFLSNELLQEEHLDK